MFVKFTTNILFKHICNVEALEAKKHWKNIIFMYSKFRST